MSLAPHRIRRQQWRVKAPSQESAFALRMLLRTRMHTELLPAFERAFDGLGVGEDVVRIPRLDLELRVRAGDPAPDAIARQLVEQLGDALRDWAAHRPGEMRANRMAPAANRHRMLLHYLAHGHVEWHAGAESAETLAASLRAEASALAREPGAFRDLLRGSAAQRMAAGFRLLQLLEPAERSALLGQAPLDEFTGPPRELAYFLRELAAPGRLAGYASLRAQALFLAWTRAERRDSIHPEFVTLLRECLEQAAPPASSGDLRAAMQLVSRACADSDVAPGRREGDMAPAQQRGGVSTADDATLEDATLDDATLDEFPAAARDLDEGVPAHDAGLVLLHPYFERLFDAAGIARDDAGRVPDTSLPRAAALLHWLLAGREEIHEFELAAIKVLLGQAPERMLLVAAGLLSDNDRAEADALLAAAVSHWSVLGETRIDGLRQTFLQRRGVLRDLGHAWSLQVEPAAFDVLLGSLPWAFNIVKLPWMTRPIFIEWPTP